jgi:hypothetical protein
MLSAARSNFAVPLFARTLRAPRGARLRTRAKLLSAARGARRAGAVEAGASRTLRCLSSPPRVDASRPVRGRKSVVFSRQRNGTPQNSVLRSRHPARPACAGRCCLGMCRRLRFAKANAFACGAGAAGRIRNASEEGGGRGAPWSLVHIFNSALYFFQIYWGTNFARISARALGKFSSRLKVGIVGLPNVGKSTLYNTLTKCSIPAENFPFCTIEPNETRVNVPDERFDWLVEKHQPKSIVEPFKSSL